MSKPSNLVQGASTVDTSITAEKIRLASKSHLSAWHVLAAQTFAKRAGDIEKANAGAPFGDFFHDIATNVMGAVFFSVASVEAAINEIFSEPRNHFPNSREIVEQVWQRYERSTKLLEKFDLALIMRGKPVLNPGTAYYGNFKALAELRNALVHYHPEWSDELDAHRTIEKRLSKRFPLSPFVGDGNPFFPSRCMSHGCARWAVKTALIFNKHFCSNADLNDPLAPYHERVDYS